jgi:PAS domain S-box-containing protein
MHSIQTILIAILSPIMVLVGCGTSLVYYQYAVEKEKAVMDRFVDTESSILPAEIAVLLKKNDLDGVRLVCRERLNDHRIQSLRVIDAKRQVIFSKDDENRTASLFVMQPIIHGNDTIGTVQIAFDQSELHRLERHILILTCSILFFVSGAAIFVVLLLTRWFIARPLGHVEQALDQLQNEQYDWTFQGSSLKEIQPIVDGLKGLSRKLHERKNRIETQTRSLEEYNQSLLEEIERRKAVESALEASKKKLQAIIDKSPIGICTVDLYGKIVAANLAYAHMLGYTLEELRGMSFFDLTHPDYRPKNREIFLQFSQKRNDFAIDKVYLRKDGTPIEVSLYAVMVKNHETNSQFGIAFVQNITHQKHAQRELMQSTQLLESVLNGIVDPVFVKDQKHRWIMLNDAFCKMVGHTSQEMLGKTDHDFFPMIRQRCSDRETRRFSTPMCHTSGTNILALTIRPAFLQPPNPLFKTP